jgi:hypothetical protein
MAPPPDQRQAPYPIRTLASRTSKNKRRNFSRPWLKVKHFQQAKVISQHILRSFHSECLCNGVACWNHILASNRQSFVQVSAYCHRQRPPPDIYLSATRPNRHTGHTNANHRLSGFSALWSQPTCRTSSGA